MDNKQGSLSINHDNKEKPGNKPAPEVRKAENAVRSTEAQYNQAKKESAAKKKKAAKVAVVAVATVATGGAAGAAAGGAAAGGAAAGGAAAGGAAAGSAAAGGAAAGGAAAGSTAAGGAAAGGAAAGSSAGGAAAGSSAAGSATETAKAAEQATKTKDSYQKAQDAMKRLREAEEKTKKTRDTIDRLSPDEDEDEDEQEENEDENETEETPTPPPKKSLLRRSLSPLIVGTLLLAITLLALPSVAILYPFHMASNAVDKIVSFVSTLADKIKHVFVGDYLEEGEVPKELADNLSSCGIEVGVTDETGNFIKTNKIIASGSEYLIAATDGSFVPVQTSGGKLGIKFEGEFIPADKVMERFEKDNNFYVAFENAVGSDSTFFYDRSAEETFSDLGVNRDPYANFEPSGDEKKDQESFKKMFADAIDYDPSNSNTNVDTTGDEGDETEGGDAADAGSSVASNTSSSPSEEAIKEAKEKAKEYIKEIAEKTEEKGEDAKNKATRKAAALINAAISANEPFQAARASTAVLVGVEQAKAGEGGPIHELATFLTTAGESESSGETEGGDVILDSNSPASAPNLSAVTQLKSEFNEDAAAKYSRDYVIETTEKKKEEEVEDGAINGTVVTIISGFKSFLSWIISLFSRGEHADVEFLQKNFTTQVANALFLKTSETMVGETLGEKIVEGTSFMNTSLAKNTGASNVSGREAVAAYNDYTKKLYDRAVIADRATRSPFDISSPNTFLGSIVNNVFAISTNNKNIVGRLAGLSNLATRSFGNLIVGAYADDDSDTFLGASLNVDSCSTVQSIGGRGDLYCNQIATYDTSEFSGSSKNSLSATLKDYLSGDLSSELGDYLEGDGSIKDGTDFTDYIILGAGRESSPGVQDANVCQTKKQGVKIGGLFSFLFSSADDVKKSCEGEDLDIATGKKYGNVEGNAEWDSKYKYFQGYYLETYALEVTGYYKAKGKDNPIVAYKEAYYEAHPKDNSFEGVIARRTGWLKEDVIAGLKAVYFLAYLENYDPTERLAFVKPSEEKDIYFEEVELKTDERIAEKKEIIFDKKRNYVVLI